MLVDPAYLLFWKSIKKGPILSESHSTNVLYSVSTTDSSQLKLGLTYKQRTFHPNHFLTHDTKNQADVSTLTLGWSVLFYLNLNTINYDRWWDTVI